MRWVERCGSRINVTGMSRQISFRYINTNEIPGELSREDMISSLHWCLYNK